MATPPLDELVSRFVAELEKLVGDYALAAAEAAFSQSLLATGPAAPRGDVAKPPGRAGEATRAGRDAAPPRVAKSARAGGGRRAPRTAAEIEQAAHRVLEFVRSHPGSKPGDIKKALRLDTSEWQVSIRRLAEKGALKAKGERRGTSYTVA